MVLANDNFWGYTTCLLFKYQVTWIEAAIVQPCWTSMLVCYVEGDEGHLLGEHVQQQTHRTRVRGTAHSFHMPWEDILHELHAHCATDTSDITSLPRSPECLKYILKVHLRVDRQNMGEVLRQLTVRPFVLLQLLYFLIDHNHEVFRNKGNINELREQMRQAVAKLYPICEADKLKPAEEQTSQLPDDLVDLIQPSTSARKTKTVQLIREKNATPGDGGSAPTESLWHNRPQV